jgi:hypothetical protein
MPPPPGPTALHEVPRAGNLPGWLVLHSGRPSAASPDFRGTLAVIEGDAPPGGQGCESVALSVGAAAAIETAPPTAGGRNPYRRCSRPRTPWLGPEGHAPRREIGKLGVLPRFPPGHRRLEGLGEDRCVRRAGRAGAVGLTEQEHPQPRLRTNAELDDDGQREPAAQAHPEGEEQQLPAQRSIRDPAARSGGG